jgi:flagellar biosynthesis protein FlhG
MNLQATALRELVARRQGPRGVLRTRTLAVTSGKGGVGKTTLSANLAIALQQAGLRVVLVDVDLGLANVDVVLDLRPRFTLQHVLEGERTLPEIVVEGPAGLRVVPASSGIEELANLTPWQQERLWSGFAELDRDTDLVVIDTAAGIAPNVLSVLAAAEEVLVVTAPDPAAITDAYALIKVLSRHNPGAAVHLVVNRGKSRQEAYAALGRIVEVARRFLGVEVAPLGFVLEDPAAQLAARQRRPFVAAYPSCPAARCVASLAARLRGRGGEGPGRSLAECVRHISNLQVQSLTQGTE